MNHQNSKNIIEIPFSKGRIFNQYPPQEKTKICQDQKINGIPHEPYIFGKNEKKEENKKLNYLNMPCGISNIQPVRDLSNPVKPFIFPNLPNPLLKFNQTKVSFNNFDFSFKKNEKEFPSISIIFLNFYF